MLEDRQDRQPASSREGSPPPAARQTTRAGTSDRTARKQYARPPFGPSRSSGLSVPIPSWARSLLLQLRLGRLDQLNVEKLERIGDGDVVIDACAYLPFPHDVSGNTDGNDIAEPVHHRSSAVAPMDNGVALDDLEILARVALCEPEFAGRAIGADDAFGYRRRQFLLYRRPDRVDLGGDLRRFDLQRQCIHGRFVHLDQGDIARLVRPQHLAWHLTPGRQLDRDELLVSHHVLVGQKIPVPGDEEAAAVTATGLDRDNRCLHEGCSPLRQRRGHMGEYWNLDHGVADLLRLDLAISGNLDGRIDVSHG